LKICITWAVRLHVCAITIMWWIAGKGYSKYDFLLKGLQKLSLLLMTYKNKGNLKGVTAYYIQLPYGNLWPHPSHH
jgi:hypothetical protein